MATRVKPFSAVRPVPEIPLTESTFHAYIWVPAQKAAIRVWDAAVAIGSYLLQKISTLFYALYNRTCLPSLLQRVSACTASVWKYLVDTFMQAPALLKHFAIFQTIEVFLPSPLKAAISSCYCYTRDLLAKWSQDDLRLQISQLELEKNRLKTSYEEALKEIQNLSDSRDAFLKIGHLDQRVIQNLNEEIESVRARLEMNLEKIENGKEKEQLDQQELDNLQTQIQQLKDQLPTIFENSSEVESSSSLSEQELKGLYQLLPASLRACLQSEV